MNRVIKLIIASIGLFFVHIGFAHNISENECAAKELRQLGFIHQNTETKTNKQTTGLSCSARQTLQSNLIQTLPNMGDRLRSETRLGRSSFTMPTR